jgi:hypothetical protein
VLTSAATANGVPHVTGVRLAGETIHADPVTRASSDLVDRILEVAGSHPPPAPSGPSRVETLRVLA